MMLDGKVAIITGSSRGIGKAIALEMARQGAEIVVTARTEVESDKVPGTIYKTAQEIEALGRRALAVKMDVTVDEQVDEMIKRVISEFGHIDILVNNAGTGSTHTIINMPIKTWDRIMSVNLRSAFVCSKMALPHLLERGGGHIINLSSFLATTVRHSVAYGTTKAAINRFTLGMADELKDKGIAVNALSPGYTVTEQLLLTEPDMDHSKWEKAEMWAKYACMVACQPPAKFTGKILTLEVLQKELGNIKV